MKQEELDLITKTTTGYSVRKLRWKAVDCIITGQVKCPVMGKDTYNEGYITCAWRRNGKPTNLNRGNKDFILNLYIEDEDENVKFDNQV